VPIMDPQLPAVASMCELGAEAMPPLWQYLWALDEKKQTSPSAHAKASAPRPVGHFSCKAATSKGAAMGAMGPIMDPQSCRRFASVREL
jgi:hypothetical protein